MAIVEIPRNIKYGKIFRVEFYKFRVSSSHNYIYNYKIGLKALETKQLRYFHIKTIIMVLKKLFKKEVKFKFNVAFNYPVTKKPEQARMGKGKGKRHHWVALVRKGTILLEICGTSKITNFNLMNSLLAISYKLPIKCMFVKLMY